MSFSKKVRLNFHGKYFRLGDRIHYNCFGLPTISGTIEEIVGGKENPTIFIRTSKNGLAAVKFLELQSMSTIR